MSWQIGDWVRFYRNGELVIGVVEYRNKAEYGCDFELSTTAGCVNEEYVLEGRKKVTR